MAEIDSAYKGITAVIVSLASSFQSYSVWSADSHEAHYSSVQSPHNHPDPQALNLQHLYPFFVQICTIWANKLTFSTSARQLEVL